MSDLVYVALGVALYAAFLALIRRLDEKQLDRRR